jgi:tetratricopeptide (TPR) repeat protein
LNSVIVFALSAFSLWGQSPDVHVAAARNAEAAGDFAGSEREYEKSLRAHPDAEIYQRLGLVRHLQNKYKGAIPAFRNSLKLQPNQWAARLFLGIDLYRTNAFPAAMAELKIADQLKVGDFDIRFWMGATHLALRDYFAGLEMLEGLRREQPNNAEVLRLLAENYALFSAALSNEVAEKYPGTAAGMMVHGQALEFEGAWGAALAAYREVDSRWPGRAGVGEAMARLQGKASAVRDAVPPSQP